MTHKRGSLASFCFLVLVMGLGLFVATPVLGQANKSQKDKQGIGTKSDKEQDRCKLPKLREELLRRMEVDQKARRVFNSMPRDWRKSEDEEVKKKWQAKIDHVVEVDRENREWMKPLIEKHGWLGKSLVGKDGANAAWLLAQHSDMDRKFQKQCLGLMEKMPKGEVTPIQLGYLTDRVLVAEGKPQRYGTQIKLVDGKPTPHNLEDPENLNKRRKEIGLGTIEEYLKLFDR